MFSTLSVNNVLAESKEVHHRILLERIPSDGEQLHRFIDAMKQSVRIILRYRRYGSEESSLMFVEPYFVKLFNKRWYAVVRHPDDGGLFTLAFDRIVSLELTDQVFEYDPAFDPSAWFRDCYGIVNDHTVPVETVVIRAFGREPHYLRDLPLHHSQRELNATDEHTDFELTLRPTADFITPLLSRGAAICVLSPQWLADTVKQCHLDAAKRYE
jgi:predicted DNA-binding transcriptional regulator YafY